MRLRDWIVVLILVIAGAGWYFYSHYPVDTWQTKFFVEGNLIKDNPGFSPGEWYLSFEEPGFPGLSVHLVFDDGSRCGTEGKLVSCANALLVGDRVAVEGVNENDRVVVRKLIFTKPTERGMPIHLFFYDSEKDTDARGNIQCSKQGLVAVSRVLPHTETPLADAIKLLFRGEISDEEKAMGIGSELPLLGVRLEKADIHSGIATLTFSDEQNKTSGGSCRVAILWAQIEATAKQFPGVTEVHFMPDELFQP